MKRLLVVDDDVAVTNFLLVFFMQTERFDAEILNDSREVLPLMERSSFDALLVDMDMPSVSGLDILASLRSRGDETPVVVLTGVSDLEIAVRAMKAGAFDYLTKPVDEEHLLKVIDAAIAQGRIQLAIDSLPRQLRREDLKHSLAFARFPNQDPSMIRLLHQAEKTARSSLPVFIWGERGTERETLARAIHESSACAEGPFVAVDVAEQEREHFPAAFFGQARDWSGEREEMPGFLDQAQGGTMLLDNIDQLSRPMQVRLKRVIQTGEYYRESSTRILQSSVRFIVSSTRDLTNPSARGDFSSDLLYHLMVNSLSIPSLRDRPADIPCLAQRFLEEESERVDRPGLRMSADFLALLCRHEFPDNARELRDVIAASVACAEGEILGADTLPPYLQRSRESAAPTPIVAFQPKTLSLLVLEHAERTLEHFGQDPLRAAAELGISAERLQEILSTDPKL